MLAANHTWLQRKNVRVMCGLFWRAQGEALLDPAAKVTAGVAAEYARCTAEVWSSKGMLELIRRKMSSAAAVGSPDRPSTSTSSPLGAAPDQAAVLYLTMACACLPGHSCCLMGSNRPEVAADRLHPAERAHANSVCSAQSQPRHMYCMALVPATASCCAVHPSCHWAEG